MLQAGVTARDSPCSSLCNVDPNTLIIRDLPPLTHRGLSPEAAREYDELELHAFRICFDCHTTLMRAQYRTECRTPTPLVRLYTALVSLQKKIEEALPDFHEMILGLQYVVADRKNDATCTLASAMNDSIELQHDAAQARKNLLHQFAQYDKFAKQIRDLQHQSNAEGQVQQAIYLRATLFLQKHVRAKFAYIRCSHYKVYPPCKAGLLATLPQLLHLIERLSHSRFECCRSKTVY